MTAAGGDRAPVASLVRSLLDARLLTLDEAVSRGIVVVERSMSHRAFRVEVGGVPRLFVKVADPVRSAGRDLATEAAVYRLALSSPSLAAVVPRCHAIRDGDATIVLEAVPGVPLSDTALAAGGPAPGARDGDHEPVLGSYGRAVARVHATRPPPFGEPPWLLAALEPRWGDHAGLPEPCRRLLLGLAATPAARDGFRRAASAWRGEGLIHADLRWSNALVAAERRPPRIWLVNWELACVGDPAWDIASVLADIVTAAAGRGGPAPPDVAPVARPFLQAYRAESRASAARLRALLARSVAMVGVRIVQTLIEYGAMNPPLQAAMEPILLPWALDLLAGRAPMARQLAGVAARGGG